MAEQVNECTIGVDVAKDWLDIYTDDRGDSQRIDNNQAAIDKWLGGLTGPVLIAIEATNIYHELFIERAHEQGHRVYVIDAFKLSRYRDAVGHRAKTDAHDAELLATSRSAPGKILAPVEASRNAGSDGRAAASGPGRH